jgi:hypothetical protein
VVESNIVSYSKEQMEVLVATAETLILLQTAEKIIRFCMTFVFQKQTPFTYELLQQQEQAERKKTIGYFLSELRKRATVDESFDLLLEGFLLNRNNFIHDLSRFQAWDFHKKKDNLESRKLIHDIKSQTELVMKVFTGFSPLGELLSYACP